jgi:hypothetical protein
MISFGTEMRRLYNYSSIAEKAVTLILIFSSSLKRSLQQSTKAKKKSTENKR